MDFSALKKKPSSKQEKNPKEQMLKSRVMRTSIEFLQTNDLKEVNQLISIIGSKNSNK